MYNGWRNWETWCVNLHLTNNERMLKYARLAETAEDLREYVSECLYEARYEYQRAVVGPKGVMACDLAEFTLRDVDWERIFEVLHQD